MATECELCAFGNPRVTATAAFIKDGKLLLTKRAQDPFKGMWDLPGGYLVDGESPEDALRREMREELGVSVDPVFMQTSLGFASYRGKEFGIISFNYLVDIGDQKIQLNEENSDIQWVLLKDVEPEQVAFSSNQALARFVKEKFQFDLPRVAELIRQLDPSAVLREHILYRAVLNGFVAQEFDGDRLIGMGWVFPRQTALRKQAVVEDMIVDEAYRGKGLGKKILHSLIEWAKRQGVEVVELTSNPARVPANELYKKYGFQLHPTNHYLYKVI